MAVGPDTEAAKTGTAFIASALVEYKSARMPFVCIKMAAVAGSRVQYEFFGVPRLNSCINR